MTLIGIGNAGNGMFWSILAEFVGQIGSQIGKYGFPGKDYPAVWIKGQGNAVLCGHSCNGHVIFQRAVGGFVVCGL